MSVLAAKIKENSFYEKTIEGLDGLPSNAWGWIKELQEMFNDTVRNKPYTLRYVPDWLKAGEMFKEVVKAGSWQLGYVPDHLKT